MYRIYSDDNLIYDPRLPEYSILQGTVRLEVNTSGELLFEIADDHPQYGKIKLMKSIVTLYDDNRLLFRGRPYAPTVDMFKASKISCEGELAFFNDTYYAPFTHSGSVASLFTAVINNHNSQVSEEKRFIVGRVTVTNDTQSGNIERSSEYYLSTWELIKTKFIESSLGGYLWIRHEDNGIYIDYLEDLEDEGEQNIEQTINLVDGKKKITSDELATVIVPLGAHLEDGEGHRLPDRLTIASVNGGKIYIESTEGIALYGRIAKIVDHDDITIASNLLTAGRKDLAAALGVTTSYTLTAADLSRAGYDVEPFMYGTKVKVRVPNLAIEQKMLIRRLDINLLSPESNKITVGASAKSLVAQ